MHETTLGKIPLSICGKEYNSAVEVSERCLRYPNGGKVLVSRLETILKHISSFEGMQNMGYRCMYSEEYSRLVLNRAKSPTCTQIFFDLVSESYGWHQETITNNIIIRDPVNNQHLIAQNVV